MFNEAYENLITQLIAEQHEKEEHRRNTEAQGRLLLEFLERPKSMAAANAGQR